MASAYAVFYVVFILFIFLSQAIVDAARQNQSSIINPGSSLSPSSEHQWTSPSGRFAFGFYRQGSGFLVGCWLVTRPNITVVWTAYRDEAPVPSNARLTLTMEGKLVLKTDKDKVIANPSESAYFASMLDSGEFVLCNKTSGTIWTSFNFPTDTILGGQNLYAGFQLISNLSESSSSSGRFRLKMQEDRVFLYPTNTIDDDYTEAYWPTSGSIYPRGQAHLYLNHTGELVLLNDSMHIIQWLYYDYSPSYNSSIIYRATLGYDGIFRLYSYFFSEVGYNTSIKMSEPENKCDVISFCGLNSYCALYDDQPACHCLPGTAPVDSNQMFSGCKRNFSDEKCRGSRRPYNMTLMEIMTWNDYPYLKETRSEEDCKNSCLEDCNCDAVLWTSNSESCQKHKLPLKSARRDQKGQSSSYAVAYFKMGYESIRRDNDSYTTPTKPPSIRIVTSKRAIILILVITSVFATCSCVFLATSGYFVFKHRVLKYKRLLENGNYFGSSEELCLRSFSYSELKKATNGFKQLLGKGSFGAVYKGSFRKGEKLVAVKRLEKVVTEGEREFQAEMHVIGRTHHKNLVQLFGYCAEGSRRLLVYEYMSNGSLADLIFHSKISPVWDERVRIALDVAKGILYLHEECEAPIIHCDIKPQNILMDEYWTAKISDFGLAKLLMPDQTRTFTLIRGTRGYLAPEWYKNTPISVKADIYSFGVVLLEIVCCRRNLEIDPSKPEEVVLTNWVYKCFTDRELKRLVRGQEVDKKTLENMVKVGLWCVQDEPALRPSMKSVVMMLEGITDISIPPCPTAPPML